MGVRKIRISTISIILIHINLIGCSENNDFVVTTQYAIENDLPEKISIELYGREGVAEILKSLVVNSGDSILFFECRSAKSNGACSPYDDQRVEDITSDFGAIIFNDGKRLNFERGKTLQHDLFSLEWYNEVISIGNRTTVYSYTIDEEDYMKAE